MAYPFHLAFPVRDLDETRRFYEGELGCGIGRSGDDWEALVAWRRGTRAMQNPLLLIPSDLLDLWGPNRCRSAVKRHDLPVVSDESTFPTSMQPPD